MSQPAFGRLRVERRELRLLSVTALFAFSSVTLAILIRTWSDTLFLRTFPAEEIPFFYVMSALLFFPTTMGYTWIAQRSTPLILNQRALLCFAILTTSALLLPSTPPVIFSVILLLALISPLVNAICWSMILEQFSSRQARRLVPLIGGISTAGAAAGGLLSAELIEGWGEQALMLVIVGLLLLMVPFPRWVTRVGLALREERVGDEDESDPLPPKQPEKAPRANSGAEVKAAPRAEDRSFLDALKILAHNRLLQSAGLATLLLAIATNLVDYSLKEIVKETLSPDEIGPFFARFHGLVNLSILFLQFTVVTPTLSRLGVRRSFQLHPFGILICTVVALFAPSLWALVALRAVDTAMKFSFQSSTENLLLTPVPFAERASAKVILKGAIYPIGGLIAGLLLMGTGGEERVLWTILVASFLWLIVTDRVQIYYLEQLAKNLKLSLQPRKGGRKTRTQREALTALRSMSGEGEMVQFDFLEAQLALALAQPQLRGQLWPLLEAKGDHRRADLIEWIELSLQSEGLAHFGEKIEQLQFRDTVEDNVDRTGGRDVG
ncbi:MAG: hypothetical protein VYD19_09120 [Myxococcota bacterium]|nr:hypothetical protein [Myxococcota bacterium]